MGTLFDALNYQTLFPPGWAIVVSSLTLMSAIVPSAFGERTRVLLSRFAPSVCTLDIVKGKFLGLE